MPVSWGDSPKHIEDRMSDLHQYAKWFNKVGYDFSLSNIGGKWICSAWLRQDESATFTGETMNTPVEALHDCYSNMRDLGVAPKD